MAATCGRAAVWCALSTLLLSHPNSPVEDAATLKKMNPLAPRPTRKGHLWEEESDENEKSVGQKGERSTLRETAERRSGRLLGCGRPHKSLQTSGAQSEAVPRPVSKGSVRAPPPPIGHALSKANRRRRSRSPQRNHKKKALSLSNSQAFGLPHGGRHGRLGGQLVDGEARRHGVRVKGVALREKDKSGV